MKDSRIEIHLPESDKEELQILVNGEDIAYKASYFKLEKEVNKPATLIIHFVQSEIKVFGKVYPTYKELENDPTSVTIRDTSKTIRSTEGN